jgi:hypothetical protein
MFIIAGMVFIVFPRLAWRYDWAAYRKGSKYKKGDKLNSMISGIIFVILGLVFIIGGYSM